jgi:hypothetical protein
VDPHADPDLDFHVNADPDHGVKPMRIHDDPCQTLPSQKVEFYMKNIPNYTEVIGHKTCLRNT